MSDRFLFSFQGGAAHFLPFHHLLLSLSRRFGILTLNHTISTPPSSTPPFPFLASTQPLNILAFTFTHFVSEFKCRIINMIIMIVRHHDHHCDYYYFVFLFNS